MARRIARTEAGGAARGFTILLVVVIIIALAGVVLYLLSDLNARRYRIADRHGQLVVQKGRNLPVGFVAFVPKAEALRAAYEPLEMPEGARLEHNEEFNDRADLDRALFMVLAGWARGGLKSEDPKALARATDYIARCQVLPGLSEQQRIELNTLRADLAYQRGTQMVRQTTTLLEEAMAEFQLSKQLGTSRPTNSDQWIGYLQQRLPLFGARLPGNLPANPQGQINPFGRQPPQPLQPGVPPGSALGSPQSPPPIMALPPVIPPGTGVGSVPPPVAPTPTPTPLPVPGPAATEPSLESPGEKPQPGKWRL